MGGIFRAVSTIEMRAAITIAESAMLKIGQYGNCSQSITWPRNKPGSRKIRSIEFPIIPPKTRPKTTAQPFEVIRGEKYKIITRTTKEKIVRKIVAPVANENAAPGFRTKVSWKKEPSTLIFDLCESVLTAQIFVAKSRIQTNQATLKSVRHVRTVSAVLPSACRACRELPEGKLGGVLFQLELHTLRNFHKFYCLGALAHALFAKPCHAH